MKKYSLFFCFLFLLLQHTVARTNVPVSFMHDGLSVHARLTLPARMPPYRVIIIAPGSGANDMDGTIPMLGSNINCLYPGLAGDTLRPYKGLAEALADSGYAVLTYDKIEYTYPSTLGTVTFHKLWLPVVSALEYLKTRTDIDATHTVLLGHSEGSSLIPYIARSHPEVKALISLAGPRRSIYDTVLNDQLNYIARTCGGDTAAARTQGGQLLSYFALIRSGAWNASTPAFAGVPAAVWSDYTKVTDSVIINYNLAASPTLFIGLGNDINVPIATELHRFRQEITSGADFFEIAGLNHYLVTPTNPATSKVLADTIVYWLRGHGSDLAVNIPAASQKGGELSLQGTGRHWVINAKGETLIRVEVYDLNGRVIYHSAAEGSNHIIELDASATGIYLFRITGSTTDKTFKVSVL